MMRRESRWALGLILSLVSSPFSALADHPLPTDPDDYDVPRYERIYADAVERLRAADAQMEAVGRLLVNRREALAREQAEHARIMRDLEAARARMDAAHARIDALERAIAAGDQELQQIAAELPNLNRQLTADERALTELRAQLQQARREQGALEASARQKDQDARALEGSLADKRRELEVLERRFRPLEEQLTRATNEKAALERSLTALRQTAAAKARELETARGGIAQLEATETARKGEYDRLDAEATEAERLAREARERRDPNTPVLERRAQGARVRANTAKREWEEAKRALVAGRNQVARIERELADANRQVTETEAAIAGKTQQIAELEGQARELRPAVEAKRREVAQIEALARGARAEAEQAAAAAVAKKTEADRIAGREEALERRVAEARARRDGLAARKAQLDRDLASWRAELPRQQHARAEALRDVRALTPAFERSRDEVARVAAAVAQSERDYEIASRAAAEARSNAEAWGRRYAEVRENLRRGLEVAQSEGVADGSPDGAAEGARVGNDRGDRDGRVEGERRGREEGTREGIRRARAAGEAEGRAEGETEGRAAGRTLGLEQGRTEGTRDGRAQGLQAGYDAGKAIGTAEGEPKGREAGLRMGGYERGKTEGISEGERRAREEGERLGSEEGRRETEARYMNADLAEVTLPNGSASASFTNDWENLNPRRRYPVPALDRAYLASYESSFVRAADDAFGRVYETSKHRASEAEARRVFPIYADRDYPQEKAQAKDVAKRAAFEQFKEAARVEARNETYEPARLAAYNAALPVRREEGRRDGYNEAFERVKNATFQAEIERGRVDGRRIGWDRTYQGVFDRAKAAATAEVDEFFRSNAVLRYEAAVLADGNGDGVFAPGEEVTATVVMKNYGLIAPSVDVVVAFAAVANGLEIGSAQVTLAPVPGQSRATVTGVGRLRVPADATVGSARGVHVEVAHKGMVVGQVDLQAPVGYPYAVTSVEVANYAEPGAETPVRVQVRNSSSRAAQSGVIVRLVSVDGLATVTRPEMAVGRIGAGNTAEAQLAFTVSEDNAFQRLSFEVQVLEGDWLLGKRGVAVDSTRRWVHNPGAIGLVVVSDAATARRVDAASRALGAELDLWDTRVEGELTEEAATHYRRRMLIVPTMAMRTGAGTVARIDAHLAAGGALFAGATADGWRTSVGQAIARAKSAAGMTEEVFRSVARGVTLGTVKVVRGNFFRANQSRATLVLSENPAELAGALYLAEVITADIAGKVRLYGAAVASNGEVRIQAVRDAIVAELGKEMRDDGEADAGAFKKDNRARTRLAQFITLALAQTGNTRRGLVSLYPELNRLRKQHTGWISMRRAYIRTVLKPLAKAYGAEIDR